MFANDFREKVVKACWQNLVDGGIMTALKGTNNNKNTLGKFIDSLGWQVVTKPHILTTKPPKKAHQDSCYYSRWCYGIYGLSYAAFSWWDQFPKFVCSVTPPNWSHSVMLPQSIGFILPQNHEHMVHHRSPWEETMVNTIIIPFSGRGTSPRFEPLRLAIFRLLCTWCHVIFLWFMAFGWRQRLRTSRTWNVTCLERLLIFSREFAWYHTYVRLVGFSPYLAPVQLGRWGIFSSLSRFRLLRFGFVSVFLPSLWFFRGFSFRRFLQ